MLLDLYSLLHRHQLVDALTGGFVFSSIMLPFPCILIDNTSSDTPFYMYLLPYCILSECPRLLLIFLPLRM